jgi:hypothetical protein
VELTPVGHANLCLVLHRLGSADCCRDYDRVLATLGKATVPDDVGLVTLPMTLTVGNYEWHEYGARMHELVFHRSTDAHGWDIGYLTKDQVVTKDW